jgi:ribosomal protein S18 acetylase RimI-like enzyme
MPAAVTVRPAIATDRRDVREAIVELQEHERALHPTRLPGERIADAYWDWLWLRLEAADGAMLVAESDGAFVGFIVGWIETVEVVTETPDSNRSGYVSDLFVLPAFRGRGVATLLLKAIETRLRRADIRIIRLSALAANVSARSCYEKSGFAPYEVVYEKALEPRRPE